MATPRPGEIIQARYQVERALGHGGMGAVYLCQDLRMGRPCAVKTILLRQGEPQAERAALIARLESEVSLASGLQHPNTVRVDDKGVLPDKSPFLVMPRLQGRSLRDQLSRQGATELRRCARFLEGCLDALAGLLRKDLTPRDLFSQRARTGMETLTLIDFGVACLLEKGRRLTQSSQGGAVAAAGVLRRWRGQGS
jgi:serine/threonine-protein kinase